MLSKKAVELLEDWTQEIWNCNPDNFDMYIYNDFFSFGQLSLVDRALRSIHSRIQKKALEDAYHKLEALIAVNNLHGDWMMANDGDRVLLTDELMGASLVKVLRGLEKDGNLNIDNFPNLETILKLATKWGDSRVEAEYPIVLRGVAKRLFHGKPPELIAREKDMLKEWIATLDEEEQQEVNEAMSEEAQADEEGEGEGAERWFDERYADEYMDDRSFKLSRVWKEYTTYLQEVPTMPLRGPPIWDLTQWTEEEKAPFLFSNMA
ncbi:hypothetical protein BDW22DRAFT_1424941 [Trametopsis cervina]|nr:hypothetical protein BDW22DRAFT_1424941 [Trametopsis cervina]